MSRREGRPREPLEPVDTDGTVSVTVGTVLWAVAFLVLLPLRDDLAQDGRAWWLWTCVTGVLLGLFGIAYCRRRSVRLAADRRLRRQEEAATPRDPLT